ncbi:MAG TPA: cytochrome c [Steroidobacteraceae bacterium]|nr:cytochrome c [Steroidobacteraceae bacterium]
MKFIWAAAAIVSLTAHAQQAGLTIVADSQRLAFSQSQLLSRRDVRTISVGDSVYRQRFTRFKAIPMANLFSGLTLPDFAVVQCNGSDGFSAILQKARLLNPDPKASKAYLAIEDPKHPWPVLEGSATSAGPFYLVWTDPKASNIGREEWPFKVVSLVVLSDTRSVFPNIYPADDAAPNVQNGFKSFLKNCFACHKMNGNGAGSLGPDLNLPMNPTEYLDETALAALIRRPASVRSWPGMVMGGFSEAAIPDAERSDLIAYLRYMSGVKTKQ